MATSIQITEYPHPDSSQFLARIRGGKMYGEAWEFYSKNAFSKVHKARVINRDSLRLYVDRLLALGIDVSLTGERAKRTYQEQKTASLKPSVTEPASATKWIKQNVEKVEVYIHLHKRHPTVYAHARGYLNGKTHLREAFLQGFEADEAFGGANIPLTCVRGYIKGLDSADFEVFLAPEVEQTLCDARKGKKP